jgi:lysophospholipase L1-like esterase
VRRALGAALAAALATSAVAGGESTPAEKPPLRVLFLGNSLTAGYRLPDLVRAMAASSGVAMEVAMRAPGGVSLDDHWADRESRAAVDAGGWDFVVLQQGPSSRPDSRQALRAAAKRWAKQIRAAGAAPALYMVWPYRGQAQGFELVARSYRAAAEHAEARLLPAGEAWSAALAADPGLELWVEDGLHPTPVGAWLAAAVIAHGLAGVDPAALPARLELDGAPFAEIPEALAAKLRAAAAAAVTKGE